MSLLSVVNDVCAVTGVHQLQSVFNEPVNKRTALEMLAVATEMAQSIAYNTREWRQLRATATFVGNGASSQFALPANYQRMLLNSNVWRSTSAIQPMMFIADADEWTQRRLRGIFYAWGEWRLIGDAMEIWPIMSGPVNTVPAWRNSFLYQIGVKAFDIDDGSTWQAVVEHVSGATGHFDSDRLLNSGFWVEGIPELSPAVTATFNYLDRNCINLTSAGRGAEFKNDGDAFVLDERLLKLGMIWKWKSNKGSPYAEDMATYADAISQAMGADKPSPIIIDRIPMSAVARTAYPFATPTSADWSWPLR